jgi:hypothetical protein
LSFCISFNQNIGQNGMAAIAGNDAFQSLHVIVEFS